MKEFAPPDLEQLRDNIVAQVRQQVKSTAGSVSTIQSIHKGMNNKAEHLENLSHKMTQCSWRAYKVNATSAEKFLHMLIWEKALKSIVDAARKVASDVQCKLNCMTRLAEADLQPLLVSHQGYTEASS